MKSPPQSLLHEKLNYDRQSGLFVWKSVNPNHWRKVGAPAGTKNRQGYVLISIADYGQIGAHRLAWIYSFGSIPDGLEIDHKDGDPLNNALSNLRLATSQQQKRNRSVQSNNRSGLKGAYFHAAHKGKKWRSQLKIKTGLGSGKFVFLGYFHTAREAHEAYCRAAETHFGEFARVA